MPVPAVFRDPVEVSFRLTPADPVNGWAAESPSGQRLATAMAVIGPNASGKTTLLQPLAFLSWFMTSSFEHKPDAPLGITPHFTLPNEPTDFEIVLDGDDPGSLFRYRLSVTNERVISESLEKQATLRSKFQKIFDRNGDDGYRIDQATRDLRPRVRPIVVQGDGYAVGCVQFSRAIANGVIYAR